MNSKWLRAITLVGVFALTSSIAFAQNEPAAEGRRRAAPEGAAAQARPERGERGERPARTGFVTLDEKQRQLIAEARQQNANELRSLEEKLRTAQREFAKAVVAEKFDEKAAREKADAIAKIQADIAMLNAKAFSPVVPTLKPEQREQFENSPFGYFMITGGAARGITGPAIGDRERRAPADAQAAPDARRRRDGAQ